MLSLSVNLKPKQMKNLFKTSKILLLLILVVFSCSKDENQSVTQIMNPPEWIIGRWLPVDTNQPFTNDFIFSNDNVQMSSDGINYLDFNQFGFDDLPGHEFIFTELAISDNTYSFRQNHQFEGSDKSDQVYKWTKDSDNTLRFEKWWPESNPNLVPDGTDVSHYRRE